jgi:hypothetical protein
MPKARTRLRNRGFDALSQRILFGKGWRLLPTTGGLKRFMLGLWSHREGSPLVLLFRAGTVGQQRTEAAICGREFDLDDLVLPVVDSRRPAHTRLPLGTSRLLLVPIKAKLTDIDAVIGVGLPFHIRTPGSNHAECRSVAGSRPGSAP